MPRLRPGSAPSHRLDSDADVLPFPEGGVFGKPAQREPVRDAAREAELTIERLQRQFDSLRQQVENVVFHLPTDPTWRNPAA